MKRINKYSFYFALFVLILSTCHFLPVDRLRFLYKHYTTLVYIRIGYGKIYIYTQFSIKVKTEKKVYNKFIYSIFFLCKYILYPRVIWDTIYVTNYVVWKLVFIWILSFMMQCDVSFQFSMRIFNNSLLIRFPYDFSSQNMVPSHTAR